MHNPKIVFAIDPSTHSSGVAVFKDAVLIHVECVTVPYSFTGKNAVAYMTENIGKVFKDYVDTYEEVILVIEDQEWRVNNERMKPMAFAVLYGLVCSIYAKCFFMNKEKTIYAYVPRVWKKTVPKKIMCSRIYKAEIDKTLLQGANDDILDAVGLGRYFMKGKTEW